MTEGCVVVKLGGSLLDLPDLSVRIERFLEARQKERILLLVGGGEMAKLVRQWDQRHQLGDSAAHWLAIHALGVTTRFVSGLLPTSRLITSLDACAGLWSEGALPLLDPYDFLVADDPHAASLPHSWDVTSDSIAARVAEVAGAGELVLLKSTTARRGLTRSQAARHGLVDPYFPQAARQLPRVVVQGLREHAAEPVELLPG